MRAPSRRPTEQSAHADLPGRGRVVFFQSGRPLRRAERVEIDTGESGYLHSGSCGDAGAAACPALPRLLAALMPRQRGASSALPCSITCRCIPCHLLCRWCVHLLSVPSSLAGCLSAAAASDPPRHRARRILAVWQRARRPPARSLHAAPNGMRFAVCARRSDGRARPARRLILTAPLSCLLGWQQWSASLRRPGPQLTPSLCAGRLDCTYGDFLDTQFRSRTLWSVESASRALALI